jgi:hypothetical protein
MSDLNLAVARGRDKGLELIVACRQAETFCSSAGSVISSMRNRNLCIP